MDKKGRCDIQKAIDTTECTKKCYVIAIADGSEFYIPNALHIERDDGLFLCEDDEEAAKAAEADGIKLIYGMSGVPDGVYLDTPENRAVILQGLEARIHRQQTD